MSTETASSSIKDRPVALGIAIVAIGALVAAFGWSIANERGADVAVASFGGDELTRSELAEMLDTLPEGAPPVDATADFNVSSQVVRQWLGTRALEAELADVGVDITAFDREDAIAAIASAQPGLDVGAGYGALSVETRSATIALDNYATAATADADVELPEYLCSSHILVQTGEEAQEIVALLEAGSDFAELATERSGDPGSAVAGGDLGCGPTIGYVPEFSDGARAAGNGNLSAPVRSQFGWHVISVRTIGELTAENHPEMDDGEISQALGSFEIQARAQLSTELSQQITNDVWTRVAEEGVLSEEIGVWIADFQGIVPTS